MILRMGPATSNRQHGWMSSSLIHLSHDSLGVEARAGGHQ